MFFGNIVQEKKQLKEKESSEVFLSVVREKKNDIKSAQNNVFKVLGELESTVGLSAGALKKYLVNKDDFIAINKGLYDEVLDSFSLSCFFSCTNWSILTTGSLVLKAILILFSNSL